MAFVIIHFISIWWLATFLFGLLVFMHLFLYKIDGHSMLISQKKNRWWSLDVISAKFVLMDMDTRVRIHSIQLNELFGIVIFNARILTIWFFGTRFE